MILVVFVSVKLNCRGGNMTVPVKHSEAIVIETESKPWLTTLAGIIQDTSNWELSILFTITEGDSTTEENKINKNFILHYVQP